MAKTTQNNEPQPRPNYRIGNMALPDPAVAPRILRSRKSVAWSEVDRDTLAKFISDCCDTGRGLILGVTSDGGALSITILDGTQKVREYPKDTQEFEQVADWCGVMFEPDKKVTA